MQMNNEAGDAPSLWRSKRVLRPAMLAVAIGMAVSAIACAVVWTTESARVRQQFEDGAASGLEQVHSALEADGALAAAVAALVEDPKITPTEFSRRARPLLAQYRDVRAVAYGTRVSEAGRQAFEADARRAGSRSFRVFGKSLAGRPIDVSLQNEHFPVTLAESDDATEEFAGWDMASDTALAAALERSRDAGTAAMAGRTRTLDAGDIAWELLIVQPLYTGGGCPARVAERRDALHGYALVIVDMKSLLARTLTPEQREMLVLTLRSDAPAVAVSPDGPAAAGSTKKELGRYGPQPAVSPRVAEAFSVAGIPMEAVAQPAVAWLEGQPAWHAAGVLAIGLLLTAGVTLVVLLNGLRETQVRHFTTRLSDACSAAGHLVMTDPLTGLMNWTAFREALKQQREKARHTQTALALVLFDVDRIDGLNTEFGHAAGDRVLGDVARLLKSEKRAADVVARQSAGRLAMLMPAVTPAEAYAAAERFRRLQAQRDMAVGTRTCRLTVSAGIGHIAPSHEGTEEDLLCQAEQALRVAREAGGDCVRTSDELTRDARHRLDENPDIAEFCHQVDALVADAKDDLVEQMHGLIRRIDARDPFAAHHAGNVARYAVAIAETLGLDAAEIGTIRRAAILHDIGNIGVPQAILGKEGILTADERRLMERHVRIGVYLAERLGPFQSELSIIRQHHEQWDGRGYPDGVAGEAISLDARIVAVADTFDAITAGRSYRKARDLSDALQILVQESNRQFDAHVVDALVLWVRTARLSLEGAVAGV